MTFDLYYKCYGTREVIHPSAHPFVAIGPEYSTESEASEFESGDDEEEEEEEEEGGGEGEEEEE